MSYSFHVRAATKEAVLEAAAAEFDTNIIPHQKMHGTDRDQALAAAKAFVELLGTEEGKEISLSLSGSIGWTQDELMTITGAGVNVSASLVPAVAAPAA